MVTISHLIKKYIEETPFVAEAMQRDIISNPGLAEELQPRLEKELKRKIKLPAIIMALRRYSETLEEKFHTKKKLKITSEFIVKSGVCVIDVRKSPPLFKKLEKIYNAIYNKEDLLNISHGNKKISIISNEKYLEDILNNLKGEKVLRKQKNLVALNIIFSEGYLYTPGVIFEVTRRLAWNNINIVEMISSHNELSVIIEKNDSIKAFEVLQEIMS
ncbi:MAG: ACT domain-containing protein [Candidatus Nanoarchaeia archaeon]|nr:ACT domain-containing protein [Candidatus Nanoarchaeia archaeon]